MAAASGSGKKCKSQYIPMKKITIKATFAMFDFCYCDSKLQYENRILINISVFINKRIKKQKLTRFSYFDLLFWYNKRKKVVFSYFSISVLTWKTNDTKSPYTIAVKLISFIKLDFHKQKNQESEIDFFFTFWFLLLEHKKSWLLIFFATLWKKWY